MGVGFFRFLAIHAFYRQTDSLLMAKTALQICSTLKMICTRTVILY